MKDCPCGLPSPYADCCGPLIRGTGYADTAEDLMRSRYTAYTHPNRVMGLPYVPQHFLNFLPLPHGQGSLRPTLGPLRFTGVCGAS